MPDHTCHRFSSRFYAAPYTVYAARCSCNLAVSPPSVTLPRECTGSGPTVLICQNYTCRRLSSFSSLVQFSFNSHRAYSLCCATMLCVCLQARSGPAVLICQTTPAISSRFHTPLIIIISVMHSVMPPCFVPAGSGPAVLICQNYTCQAPTSDPAKVKRLLQQGGGRTGVKEATGLPGL